MNKYQEAWENILNRRESLFELNAFTVKQILLEVPTQIPMTYEVNLIQELVDRATPKKTVEKIIDGYIWRACPNCNSVFTLENLGKKFCPDCGLAIDWENKRKE